MPSALITFVLVIHSLIAVALVAVILMQRSEGGALGVGGGPGGMVSARGAANLLTRATTILAALFLGTCIVLAVLAKFEGRPSAIDTSLAPPATSAPLIRDEVTGKDKPSDPALGQPAPATNEATPFVLPGTKPSDEIPEAK
jgi:preprotein translocase subunit SecG